MIYLPNRSHYKQPQKDEMNKKVSVTMVIMVSLGFLLMLNGCLGRGNADIQGGPWSKAVELAFTRDLAESSSLALQGTRRFTDFGVDDRIDLTWTHKF